jgi:hypothetical protein
MNNKDAKICEVLNVPNCVKYLFCIILCFHVHLLGYVLKHLRISKVSQCLCYSIHMVVRHLHYCPLSLQWFTFPLLHQWHCTYYKSMTVINPFHLRFIILSLRNSDYKACYAFVKLLEFVDLYGSEEGAPSPSKLNSNLLVCSQQEVKKYDY